MPRSAIAVLALATLSVTAAQAQTESQSPAPITRSTSAQTRPTAVTTQPATGIWVRTFPGTRVQTLSATADATELRLDHGVANVSVHTPAPNSQILIDLPGGQTALLKDGFYTFNADSNTVRVLKGEAEAFPGNSSSDHGITLKEDHSLTLAASARPVEFNPADARADILPTNQSPQPYRHGDGFAPAPYYGYGYGNPYYAGFEPYGYGYPYGAWGYPYYPYGYGLGIGIGFGGYYGGGFGGYRGGFGGRGFRR